jgi:hypothetical protein
MATGDGRPTKTPATTAALLRPMPALKADPSRLRTLIGASREAIDVTASQIIEVIEVK